MALPREDQALAVGLDLGTSGCRALAVDAQRRIVARATVDLPAPQHEGAGVEQDPALWWEAVQTVLERLCAELDPSRITRLAVDGTSGSVLLCDGSGRALSPGLMYNDARATEEAATMAAVAPPECAAHGPSSGLAKLLWLQGHYDDPTIAHACTQADWIGGRLTGRFGLSDVNNVLKLGYDPIQSHWPDWLQHLPIPRTWLPEVHAAGTPLAPIAPAWRQRWGLSPHAQLVAGTTDSTAAIMATGALEVGEAITSLGSTLVMKVIAERPLFAPAYGVYSQPYGRCWLVGGASNSGGAVLRRYFSDNELAALSTRIDPQSESELDYYPLLAPGERFPHNDPQLAPRLEPRPADDACFLQGLFEGMARIEAAAYRRLEQLGAPYPHRVLSLGGGAQNPIWQAIRARALGVEVQPASITEAAYGTALLALGVAGP